MKFLARVVRRKFPIPPTCLPRYVLSPGKQVESHRAGCRWWSPTPRCVAPRLTQPPTCTSTKCKLRSRPTTDTSLKRKLGRRPATYTPLKCKSTAGGPIYTSTQCKLMASPSTYTSSKCEWASPAERCPRQANASRLLDQHREEPGLPSLPFAAGRAHAMGRTVQGGGTARPPRLAMGNAWPSPDAKSEIGN